MLRAYTKLSFHKHTLCKNVNDGGTCLRLSLPLTLFHAGAELHLSLGTDVLHFFLFYYILSSCAKVENDKQL